MENNKQLNVLVAAAPESIGPITEALSGEFEIDFVTSLTEAASYSYEQTDVIVCGLYFDESRMFDLLRYTQLHPHARTLPFICMSVVEHNLSATLTQGIEIACRALGGVGFVDLNRWYAEFGVSSAHTRVQQLIRNVARP